MAEARHRPVDHSFSLHSSHEMFRYIVNQALHDWLRPLLDDVHENALTFRSASTIHVETHGERLRQNASSIVLYLHCRLSFSAGVSNLRSTTSHLVRLGGTSSAPIVAQ